MSTSTTTKTVAASTTAALLIAGGVALYNGIGDKSSEIDWSQYDLNVPQLVLPAINVPSINVPSLPIKIVKIDDFDQLSNYTTSLESTSVNTTSLNSETSTSVVSLVSTTESSVDSIVEIPVIDSVGLNKTTDINLYTINSGVSIPELKTSLAELTAIINNDINAFNSNILSFSLEDPAADLPEWMEFIRGTKTAFVDQRNIQYDTTIVKSNKIISDWLKIYKEYKEKPDVAYVPIRAKFRMITEVRVPKNSKQLEILEKNLIYYKSEGYDSVLVAFDKDDNASDILNTIKYCMQYGKMKVWATYTGKETLHETVFMDVGKYTNILKTIAPYINGYINSWRRTSAHLWEQDQEFMKYTNTVLRIQSPNLPIIGELYFGNTHKYDTDKNVGFGLNNFKNSSAIMVVNFGFRQIDVNYLFDSVLKPYIGNTPTVGCIVGHKPYYRTTNNNKLSYTENMKIKHEIEEKFMNKGCVGVVTLSNDGKDLETNNLSETLYSSL